jgi:hypothetical protein
VYHKFYQHKSCLKIAISIAKDTESIQILNSSHHHSLFHDIDRAKDRQGSKSRKKKKLNILRLAGTLLTVLMKILVNRN